MKIKFISEIVLSVFVIAIFAFVATFWMFLNFKERVCKINLNSTACGEKFTMYMQNIVHGGSW